MKVYMAGPLFNAAELAANERLDAIVREGGNETYLPQRDGGCFAGMPEVVDGVTKDRILFNRDLEALEWCDTLLFLFDGRVPDEGACFELGYAYSKGKRCVGYKTDARTFIYGKDNLMLREGLETILHTEEELREFFSNR